MPFRRRRCDEQPAASCDVLLASDTTAVRACLADAGRSEGIEIASDPALELGSAIFETARGDLDASAEAQLAEIERGLTDRCRRIE